MLAYTLALLRSTTRNTLEHRRDADGFLRTLPARLTGSSTASTIFTTQPPRARELTLDIVRFHVRQKETHLTRAHLQMREGSTHDVRLIGGVLTEVAQESVVLHTLAHDAQEPLVPARDSGARGV